MRPLPLVGRDFRRSERENRFFISTDRASVSACIGGCAVYRFSRRQVRRIASLKKKPRQASARRGESGHSMVAPCPPELHTTRKSAKYGWPPNLATPTSL